MAQVIGQALAMMLVLFILRLIYKYSLKLTNKLDRGSPGNSAFVKGFFVVLAIAPWIGMFIYVKFYS
jgi:apolipoprotein N-acyltransferase